MRYLLVRTENLTKSFGKHAVVQRLSLDVEPGEVLALIGPAGAGKTMVLRLCLDLVHPTSGDLYLFGQDLRVHGPAVRRRIGYAPAHFAPSSRRTGWELLRLLAYPTCPPDWNFTADLAARLALPLDQPLTRCSPSDLQSLNLLQACMHQPELLLLDEPMRALEPERAAVVRDYLLALRAQGGSVLLATRDLALMETLADRAAVMCDGRLLSVERVVQVKSRLQRLSGAAPAIPGMAELIQAYGEAPYAG